MISNGNNNGPKNENQTMINPNSIIQVSRKGNQTDNNFKFTNSVQNIDHAVFFQTFSKKISTLSEIESIFQNISIVNNLFLSNYPNQEIVNEFRERYKFQLHGDYTDVLLTMRSFPDFNIFDYLNLNIDYSNREMSESRKREEKLMIITRNNIILTLLVIATEYHFMDGESVSESSQKEGSIQSENLFEDLSFLNPVIEKFKNLIVEADNVYNIEYDVEVLFLALLGYKDKARIIKQKHNNYFKSFVSDCQLSSFFNFDIFLSVSVEKGTFSFLSDNELIIFRKILNNAARRKLYYGFEFLIKNIEYCFILSEGRIWKNIGKKMTYEQVFNLWSIYEENLEVIRSTNLRTTISLEYKNKIDSLTQEYKLKEFYIKKNKNKNDFDIENIKEALSNISYKRAKLESEIHLFFVTCLKELLVIFFKSELKELVMYFFDKYKESNQELHVPIDIYEICLDYDEDISIDIMENALDQENAKGCYMQLALIKKYFRLARRLLKFKNCREYLNSPPPDSFDYIGWISKIQVKNRKKISENITYKHSMGELKIIDFLRQNSNNEIKRSVQNSRNKTVIGGEKQRKVSDKEKGAFSSIKNSFFQGGGISPLKALIDYEDDANSNNNIKTTNGNYTNTNSDLLTNTLIQNRNILNSELGDKNQRLSLQSENKKKKVNFSVNTSNFFKRVKYHLGAKPEKTEASPLTPLKHSARMSKYGSTYNNCTSMSPLEGGKSMFYRGTFNKNRRRSVHIPGCIDNYTSTNRLTVLSPRNSSDEDDYSESQIESVNLNINSLKRKETIDDIKLETVKKGKFNINVQIVLIEQLKYGEYVCDCLCLLLSIQDKSFNLIYCEKIFTNILVFTIHEEAITKCNEPLLFVALSAELLNKVGRLSRKLQYKAQTVTNEILELGEKLQSSMRDGEVLHFYLKEQTDYKGRNALEIFAENKFYTLLSDISVGSIVEKLWYGSGSKNDFFKYLRVTRILSSSINYDEYSNIVSPNFYDKNFHYFFEYSTYLKNCSGRYYLESAMMLVIVIFYQMQLYYFASTKGEEKSKTFKITEALSNFFIFCYLLHRFVLTLYLAKTKRKIKYESLEILTTSLLSLCLIFSVFLSDKVFPNSEEYTILVKSLTYSVILFSGWMKVIRIFMASYTYGLFIRILLHIFWEVFAFMMIVICVTFCFAQVFILFFSKTNDDFEYIYDGFISLFNSAFGQVTFNKFHDLDTMGYCFLMLYTTLSNIILFNLIVSIINNFYDNVKSKADAESRAVLVLAHEKMKWDEKYGLLNFLPPPFNAFSFIFCVILLLSGEHAKKLNLLFCKFFFCFIALAFFLALLVLGFIAYPFALIKSIIHSMHDVFNKNSLYNIEEYRYKYVKLCLDILARPFMLLYYIVEDLVKFWSFVFRDDGSLYGKSKDFEISKEYILILRKIFNDLKFKQKKKIITLYDLYGMLGLFNSRKKNNIKKRFEPSTSLENNYSSDSNKSVHRTINFEQAISYSNRSEGEKKEIQEIMKETFREILDKIVDTEGFVDIERALTILSYRVKYTSSYLNSLKFYNVRVIIRGMRKFLFKNQQNNGVYSFQKLRLLVYKLIIKFQLLYHYLSDEAKAKIKEVFSSINELPQFEKINEALLEYEKRDNDSEFDDGEEIPSFNLYEQKRISDLSKNYSGNFSTNSNSNDSRVWSS